MCAATLYQVFDPRSQRMSRIQRTQDLQMLKTRSLIIQNPDTSLPPIGSVLSAFDAYGRFAPTLDLSLNSIDASGGFFDQVFLKDPVLPDPGVLSYYDGTLYINDVSFNTTGIVGPPGETGPAGAQGPQGPVGPSSDLSFPFIYDPPPGVTAIQLPYRINTARPPLPANGPSGTTAEVLILWDNPSQEQFNAFELPLPLILELRLMLTDYLAVTTNLVITEHLPGAIDSAGNPLPYPIEGLLLVKGAGVSGYQVITVSFPPTPAVSFGVYVYYVGTRYSNYPNKFRVRITYTGYSDVSLNTLTIPNLAFNSPANAKPSTVFPINIDVSGSSAGITYQPPAFSDTANGSVTGGQGAPTISSYTITTTPTASAYRYGGPYNQTAVAGSTSGLAYTVTNLYPDTTYSATVAAVNSLGNSSSTISSSLVTGPDLSLTPSYVDTVQIVPYYTAADLCYNGSLIPDPVLNISSIAVGPIGIHNLATRGSSAAALMTLDVSSNGARAALAVGGFSRALGSVTANGITITERGVADIGVGATSGFYLDASFSLIVPGVSEPQSLRLTQSFSDSLTPSKSSPVYTYYWDTLTAGVPPSLSSPTVTPMDIPVCGIPMIGSPWSISVSSLSLANMGTALYVRNPIRYDVFDTSGIFITDFSGPTIPASVAGTLTGTLESADYYATTPPLTFTATNINGLTGSVTVPQLGVIVDPLSVAVASDSSGPAFLDISGIVGQRYDSPSGLTQDPDLLGPFQNSDVLTEQFECVLYQGVYWSFGNLNAFRDYSPYGPNYRALVPPVVSKGFTVNYQYTTFLWFGAVNSNSSAALALTLTFTDPVTLAGPSANYVTLTTAGSDGPIDVYYQVTCPGQYTSAWLNANSTIGRATFTTTSVILGSTVGGFSAGSTDDTAATYRLLLPTPYVSAGSTVLVAVGFSNFSTTGLASALCSYA